MGKCISSCSNTRDVGSFEEIFPLPSEEPIFHQSSPNLNAWDSAFQKSAKYRCALTHKLMLQPCKGSDGRFIEVDSLEESDIGGLPIRTYSSFQQKIKKFVADVQLKLVHEVAADLTLKHLSFLAEVLPLAVYFDVCRREFVEAIAQIDESKLGPFVKELATFPYSFALEAICQLSQGTRLASLLKEQLEANKARRAKSAANLRDLSSISEVGANTSLELPNLLLSEYQHELEDEANLPLHLQRPLKTDFQEIATEKLKYEEVKLKQCYLMVLRRLDVFTDAATTSTKYYKELERGTELAAMRMDSNSSLLPLLQFSFESALKSIQAKTLIKDREIHAICRQLKQGFEIGIDDLQEARKVSKVEYKTLLNTHLTSASRLEKQVGFFRPLLTSIQRPRTHFYWCEASSMRRRHLTLNSDEKFLDLQRQAFIQPAVNRNLPEVRNNFVSFADVNGQHLLFTCGNVSLFDASFQSYPNIRSCDLLRDFAVTTLPLIKHPRNCLTLAYFEDFVYALGGMSVDMQPSKKCERYSFSMKVWEDIDSLPEAVYECCSVVLEDTQHLYVLGKTYRDNKIGYVSELCLVTNTWRLLSVKLGEVGPLLCFTSEYKPDQIFYIQSNQVSSFRTYETQHQQLGKVDIRSFEPGQTAYYNRGKLLYLSKRQTLETLSLAL